MSTSDEGKANLVEAEDVSEGGDSRLSFRAVLRSVVKIYCTFTEPHFGLPWQMKRQNSSTSSGFVISGRRIIGNAHGVAFHSVVRVRRHGSSKKHIARVAHVGHECDLCVLTVEDDEFWEGLDALDFGGIPELQDMVNVVGYPTGGDNISVTQGIVSRVGVGKYSHTDQALLAVQIDAAINSGNSGGPAIIDSKVVGVAFETLDDAENIGYIIPTPVILHFLHDVGPKGGGYRGFCSLGIVWQAIENPGMRSALKLDAVWEKHGAKTKAVAKGGAVRSTGAPSPAETIAGAGSDEKVGGSAAVISAPPAKQPELSLKNQGVLISKVLPLGSVSGLLQANDVLMSFDGKPIASDGTTEFRENERVSFSYLITSKHVGEKARIVFVRDGSLREANVTLRTSTYLVRSHMYDIKPSFFIFGGLVFTQLSYPYLSAEFGKKWDRKAPIKLCDYAFFGTPKREDEQVVVLNQVLISDVNIGYEGFANLKVQRVNGNEIRNLADVVRVITTNTEKFVRIDLDQNHIAFIDSKHAEESHAAILKQNNIPSHISDDLKGIVVRPNGQPSETKKAKAGGSDEAKTPVPAGGAGTDNGASA